MTARGALPPFPVTPCWFSSQPFTGAEIGFLAREAGIPIVQDADQDRLADQLGIVFRQALDWVAMAEGAPLRRDALAHFDSVATHAAALLQALGLPADPQTLLTMTNDEIDVAPGMVRLRSNGPGNYAEGTRELAMALAHRGQVSEIGTPFGIARMLALAEGASKHLQSSSAKAGARPDHFSERLFNGLAWHHTEAFGVLPIIDANDRGDRSGASVTWAVEVLRLAATRIPPVLQPGHGSPETGAFFLNRERAALASVAALSPVTVADRLAAGRAFVRRHRQTPPK